MGLSDSFKLFLAKFDKTAELDVMFEKDKENNERDSDIMKKLNEIDDKIFKKMSEQWKERRNTGATDSINKEIEELKEAKKTLNNSLSWNKKPEEKKLDQKKNTKVEEEIANKTKKTEEVGQKNNNYEKKSASQRFKDNESFFNKWDKEANVLSQEIKDINKKNNEKLMSGLLKSTDVNTLLKNNAQIVNNEQSANLPSRPKSANIGGGRI